AGPRHEQQVPHHRRAEHVTCAGRLSRAARLPRFACRGLGAACALALGLLGAGPGWAAQPDVKIEANGLPSNVRDVVNKAVGSIAALSDDQDGGEDTRLRRRAREAALTALATEGYFSAQVE